ncbi:unnamed protein product [Adineta steineri]|uniref:Uncharacterized protein n=1 Tax=Adineta steineri TaxID=433720 RepID=A0A819QPP6_9BILA|nr:unnamed protein product [Adineta steineri]CAF4032913.1 unnamed protein product [Adineta steineri]
MEHSLRKYCIFFDKQIENITTDDLKISFDNIVNNYNICIKSIDVIVNQLLNVDPNQFNNSVILEHPFLLILRDLIIELLENKNVVVINLIKLFTRMYSMLDHKNSSNFHVLFYHQTLLNTLVNYRFNEEFASVIDQFLNQVISRLEVRYFSWGHLDSDEEGTYLDEVVPYMCSTAYTNTFTHLFTRSAALDQSELDYIEKFYLKTCPIYVCFSRRNKCYTQISTEILERMFPTYVDILMEFTENIKDCSSIITGSITDLMGLLQCISLKHDLGTKIMNINKDFIDILRIMICSLSIERKQHTHTLLIYSLVQMFYATFEEGLLVEIKETNIVTTLLELVINGKHQRIQFEACRLLSVVMNNDVIGTSLINKTKLIKMFFKDIHDSKLNPYFQDRLANNLFCLKNLAQNDQIKMELLDNKTLRLLTRFVTRRKQDNNSIMVCQRILEILLVLISTEKGNVLLKQDVLFLYHLKNLLSSSSDPSIQKLGEDLLRNLNAYENLKMEISQQQSHIERDFQQNTTTMQPETIDNTG